MRFEKTKHDIDRGDPYVHCPRCDGQGLIYAYTSLPSDFSPARGEYFTCPLCNGTKQADANDARTYIEDHAQ